MLVLYLKNYLAKIDRSKYKNQINISYNIPDTDYKYVCEKTILNYLADNTTGWYQEIPSQNLDFNET